MKLCKRMKISPECYFNPILLLALYGMSTTVQLGYNLILKTNCIHRGLFFNKCQLTANKMVVNFLQIIYDTTLGYAAQTVIHGPKYFMNRGTIDGGKDIKTKNDKIKIEMSRFDR